MHLNSFNMEDQTYIIVQGLNLSTGGDWMDDALQGIGRRIREARSACGMTQSELADRCNVSQTFLSRVENGKQAMNIRLLLSISDTLGVSADWLLRNDTPPVIAITNDEISRALEGCSAKERQAILHIVQTMKQSFDQVKNDDT